MTPILGIIASSFRAGAATAYESIATVTVGSGGAANVEFTSIGTDWTHLQVRFLSVRNANDFTVKMEFNSDTGANYNWHLLYGEGSSAGAYTDTRSNIPVGNIWDTTSTSYPGSGIVDILDYRNTNKFKTIRNLGGVDKNGSGSINLSSGLWRSTNAITSIKFTPSAGTFGQYTHFALYGIKSA